MKIEAPKLYTLFLYPSQMWMERYVEEYLGPHVQVMKIERLPTRRSKDQAI